MQVFTPEHIMSIEPKKPVQDNKSRQLNDHDPAYHRSRGTLPEAAERLAEQARQRSAEGTRR